ncbi:DUF1700 domain-containing protein [Paraburkholderia sp. DHOC27]|uniref:DUF1700 domain-containing protein n=1 Tax=Paraburkholderia sp. DHOC27 TaxID=2303330 RepID=UPI000E3CB14A|nr:DUF1700 domain-containing protein [Paraburkholderia sp. DHOC27]RFU47733.1 DUF1700 domain-containing protein [Paraburkholderia sp. DHOC27]
MKQDVFIETLRRELSSLPKQAVDEIIADYHEYIGDGLAAGRREEDVIAALGDPVKLARELKAQANYRQWQDRRSVGNLIRVIVSISGLGLLNVLLLVPFMIYLMLLTIGYVVSSALTIAGLVGVIALSSHHFFGKTARDALPFSFSSSESEKRPQVAASGASASAAAGASTAQAANDDDDNDSDDAPGNLKDLKIVGNRFVFDLQEGSKLSLVTRSGAIEMSKNEDGKLKFESTSEDARHMLTKNSDGTWSIARDDVVALDLKDDDDNRVSVSRSGKDGSMVWDVSSDDGDNVKVEQDGNGHSKHMTVHSGTDSVDIGSSGVNIDDGRDVIHVKASKSEYTYAVVMFPVGVIGLLLCIWLTRVTWRAVSRYVKRQFDVISASLDRGQTS